MSDEWIGRIIIAVFVLITIWGISKNIIETKHEKELSEAYSDGYYDAKCDLAEYYDDELEKQFSRGYEEAEWDMSDRAESIGYDIGYEDGHYEGYSEGYKDALQEYKIEE